MKVSNLAFAQSVEMGALPQLYAATAPDVSGGSFIGPDGFREQRGHPRLVHPSSAALHEQDARRLWEWSEQQTGVRYELGAAPATA